MQAKVLLVRGIPASGKTTYGNRLADQIKCTVHEMEDAESINDLITRSIGVMDFTGEESTVLIDNFTRASDIMPIVEAYSNEYGTCDFQLYVAVDGDGKSTNVAMSTIDRMKK